MHGVRLQYVVWIDRTLDVRIDLDPATDLEAIHDVAQPIGREAAAGFAEADLPREQVRTGGTVPSTQTRRWSSALASGLV